MVKECFEVDFKIEQWVYFYYKEVIVYCESVGDYVSCKLFIDIFEFEEEYIDFLEIQLGLIEKIGEECYM